MTELTYIKTQPEEVTLHIGHRIQWSEPSSDEVYGHAGVHVLENGSQWLDRICVYAKTEQEGRAILQAILDKLRS
jgi:hypothetical protein